MERFRAPDEARAEERGWAVVRAAYAERTPVPRRRRAAVPVVVTALVAAIAAVAFTPPGHAVVTSVRQAIGLAHADRVLSSLPTRGRVLAGAWIVGSDGSTRRLGDYDGASWSPFGRFVVAAKGEDTLVALTPSGDVRWQVGRPDVALPRWGGTHTDTRIAYFSGQRLRIVAGDGTGDHQAVPGFVSRVPPAWQPGDSFELAYVTLNGRVRVLGGFSTPRLDRPSKLAWSSDGTRLLVVTRRALDVYDAHGRLVGRRPGAYVDAAFLPRSHRIVALTRHAVLLGAHTLFRTTGRLAQVVPSPDGRWLLVTWPEADQWLFVPVRGGRIRAVGNIAAQLHGGFPVAGWTS
jgi:hypothetical protein